MRIRVVRCAEHFALVDADGRSGYFLTKDGENTDDPAHPVFNIDLKFQYGPAALIAPPAEIEIATNRQYAEPTQ